MHTTDSNCPSVKKIKDEKLVEKLIFHRLLLLFKQRKWQNIQLDWIMVLIRFVH